MHPYQNGPSGTMFLPEHRRVSLFLCFYSACMLYTKRIQKKSGKKKRQGSQEYLRTIPVVLIILFGVAPVAANILGVLLGVTPPPVVAAPTVVTARLPGGGFFTGTTTLLQRKELDQNQKRYMWQ